MKVVLLAGGFGTRLSEETEVKPKPMVEIGGLPILWHIMKHYSTFGFNEFLVALGYKSNVIKNYFLNYHPTNSEVTVNLANGSVDYHTNPSEQWLVHLVDTGLHTLTGGRVLRLKDRLQDDDTFMLTYGDGVSDIDIDKLLEFHKSHGKLATLTAVRPPARFGTMSFEGDQILDFSEKKQTSEGWINGGFFVFHRKVLDYLQDGDDTILERSPLENLASDGELMAYKHEGFWRCMDTLRDKTHLEEMWNGGTPPWRTWK